MIQLFVSDLDGTLLNENHQLDHRILHSIDFVLENQRDFAIATGRDMHPLHKKSLDFGDRHIYTICMNGAMVFDWNRHIIFERPIESSFVFEFAKTFPDLSFDYNGKLVKYTLASYSAIFARYHERNFFGGSMNVETMKNWLSDYRYDQTPEAIASQPIYKINGEVDDPQRKAEVYDFLSRHGHQIENAPFRPDFFEITAKGVNKGMAIHQLTQYLGLVDDDVAVYGDGGNDMDMMKAFRYSYAPSNASKKIKSYAYKILGPNSAYSVPIHMEETIIKNKNK